MKQTGPRALGQATELANENGNAKTGKPSAKTLCGALTLTATENSASENAPPCAAFSRTRVGVKATRVQGAIDQAPRS